MALDTIVAATDFSTQAMHAANRAVVLANATGVQRIVLLHVLDEGWLATGSRWHRGFANPDDAARQAAAARLDRAADRLQPDCRVSLGRQMLEGGLVDALARAGANADLLVIGGQGAHPLRNLMVGSTAQRLLRRSRTPLLVVRRKPEAPYRRVLVAIDLPARASDAVALAKALAPNARYDFLHAYRVPFEGKMRYAGVPDASIDFYRAEAAQAAILQMSEAVLTRLAVPRLTAHIVHGDAATKLVDKERELGADLVVLSRADKSLAEDLVFQSVTLGVLERSEADVLVVRERGSGDPSP